MFILRSNSLWMILNPQNPFSSNIKTLWTCFRKKSDARFWTISHLFQQSSFLSRPSNCFWTKKTSMYLSMVLMHFIKSILISKICNVNLTLETCTNGHSLQKMQPSSTFQTSTLMYFFIYSGCETSHHREFQGKWNWPRIFLDRN